MKKYFIKLLNLFLVLAIIIGIPYFAGDWIWLVVSWIPALIVGAYLDNISDEI